VQFELDLRLAGEALHCRHCNRRHVPDSKSKALIPKSDVPMVCGMSLFAPPYNPARDISCISSMYNTKLVLLVRRNHVATVISSERHFRKHPKGYKYLDKVSPRKFYIDVKNAQKGYWDILNVSSLESRPAMVIFYEQLVHDPEVLVHLQRFLGLPVRQLQSIEKKSSQRTSLDWLGPYYSDVLSFFTLEASPLLQSMVRSQDFDAQYDFANHFREICGTKAKGLWSKFFWMNVSCSDVGPVEGWYET
jgi:hypothetical protein